MNPPTAPKEKRSPVAAPVYFAPMLGNSMSRTIARGPIAAEKIPYRIKLVYKGRLVTKAEE